MEKFCRNCGKKFKGEEKFCMQCGTKRGEPQAVNNVEPQNACQTEVANNKEKSKTKLVVIISSIILLIVAAVVVLLVVNPFGESDIGIDKLFSDCAEFWSSEDVSIAAEIFPEEYWVCREEISGESCEESLRSIEEDHKGDIESLKEEFGDNYKISYVYLSKQEIDETTLEQIKEEVEDLYGISQDRVTKGVELDIEMEIKGDKDSHTEEYVGIYVIKIDDMWYAVSGSGRFYMPFG